MSYMLVRVKGEVEGDVYIRTTANERQPINIVDGVDVVYGGTAANK